MRRRERGTLIALSLLFPLLDATFRQDRSPGRGRDCHDARKREERILLDAVGYRVPFCRVIGRRSTLHFPTGHNMAQL